jgi:hypothetical protein
VPDPAQGALLKPERHIHIQIEGFDTRKDNPGTGAVQITHGNHVMAFTNGLAKHDTSLDTDHLGGIRAAGRIVEGFADFEITQDRQTSTRVVSAAAQQAPILVDIHPCETRLLRRHGFWGVHHIDQWLMETGEQISRHVCQLAIHFSKCLRSEEI